MSSASGASSPDGRPSDSAEFAYETIRQMILLGQLEPGKTNSQAALARELGISRTPLREAFNRLVSERLVASDYNRGVRVTELDLDDFDQIVAARLAIEPIGIRSTVGRLSAQEQAELGDALDGMDVAIAALDMGRYRSHHRTFHLGLVSHAGGRLERMIADLWDHTERYGSAYLHFDVHHPESLSPQRLKQAQEDHRQMFAAAMRGDGEECAGILHPHLMTPLEATFDAAARVPRPRVSTLAKG